MIDNNLPTYSEIVDIMERFIMDKSNSQDIRCSVFKWMSEYSQLNHSRMVVIVNKLISIKEDYYDEEFDIPDNVKNKIYKIGCDIDKQGGLDAQQACFYIARNFIKPNNNRLKAIELCWDGAGEWKC